MVSKHTWLIPSPPLSSFPVDGKASIDGFRDALGKFVGDIIRLVV